MNVKVKICGIKDETALDAALEAGADMIGLVFFPPSPRHLTCEAAAPLAARARGIASVVALTVDADDALLDEIVAAARPDILQLHGKETPERVAEVRERYALPVMKAIAVATADDALRAFDYAAADLILFDAKPLPGAAAPGGNGLTFDWTALAATGDRVPYMLSGGLTPDNVAAAVKLTGARMVDVSSGVEVRPGVKDAELIRRFLSAAKGINQTA